MRYTCKRKYYARKLAVTDRDTTNALHLLQAAEGFRARVSGEFSSIHGLSVNEFFLMAHLERAPLQRLSRVELAKRMLLSPSTVTRMAAPMEKIGLVAKQADERDARLSFVVLTETGRERLHEAHQTFAKHAGFLFRDRWTDAERRSLGELLARLVPESLAEAA